MSTERPSGAAASHFDAPRNVGSLDAARSDVGTGVVGSSEAGGLVRLQVALAAGRISEARFKAFGCGSTIAAASLASERVRGLTPAEAALLTGSALAAELELPESKRHCSELVAQALGAALADLAGKQTVGAPACALAQSAESVDAHPAALAAGIGR